MKTRPPRDEEARAKRKRRTIGIGIASFIILIMVASVLQFGSDNEEEGTRIIRGDLVFVQEDQYWNIYNENQLMAVTYYMPEDTQGHEAPEITSILNSEKVYISINPGEDIRLPAQEIVRNLNIKLVQSCYEDVEGCENLPLKTCFDATQNTGVLILKEQEEKSINLKNNCLTITGNPNEMTKYIDNIIFNLIGL